MLKNKIERVLKDAINKGIENAELGELKEAPDFVSIENTKSPEHGDRAVSLAMALTKVAKISPRKIAESIVKNLESDIFSKVDIAGPGFINLTLNWSMLEDVVSSIHEQDEEYGVSAPEERPDKSFEHVLVEYVSANPTGDLHIGHGRQAVLGSALVSLLKWAGYDVASEFYINDAGVQITKLANSAKSAMMIQEGKMNESEYPEGTYPLDSMNEFLKPEDFYKGAEALGKPAIKTVADLSLEEVGEIAKNVFLKSQEKLLAKIGVSFEQWFSEKKLHAANREHVSAVESAMKDLDKANATYEAENAKWFRAKEYGDERDRVLVKSDGLYTYLAADLAYHQDKIKRNFDKLINVWGADHHGQEPGLRGALLAVGEPSERLEIVFIQMVSLKEGDTAVKMSKRAGTVVTVRDVVEEVGVDAFRYFLVESQANNHMIFDLELAKKQDKDNPVYYIQYAHARCSSILRTVTGAQIDMEEKKLDAAPVSEEEISQYLNDFKNSNGLYDSFSKLNADESASTKALILHLANFPQEIKDSANKRAPHRIATYLKDLATLFHQFYTHNRVIVEDKNLMKARLSLVIASQKVIRNGLTLLGISAPTKM